MGRLKWEPETVHQYLDELEKIIQKVKPVQARIDRKARKLRKIKHLPQYVTQRIDNLILSNVLADRSFGNVNSVRSILPEIERNGTRKRYPALIEGQKYQVVLGGSCLSHEATGQYVYYAHDEAKSLHVGDILTYKGQQKDLLTSDDSKLHDTFEFEGLVGYFGPAQKGKANRAYLQKVEGV